MVVKSVLGVYGQNKVEWEHRKRRCAGESESSNRACKNIDLANRPNRTRDEEIRRIHLRAAGGNAVNCNNITDALTATDNNFYQVTEKLVGQYDAGLIGSDSYAIGMVNACSILFSETIRIVGPSIASKIYPGCNIHLKPTKVELVTEEAVIKNKIMTM